MAGWASDLVFHTPRVGPAGGELGPVLIRWRAIADSDPLRHYRDGAALTDGQKNALFSGSALAVSVVSRLVV
jgi:hypothetical protein